MDGNDPSAPSGEVTNGRNLNKSNDKLDIRDTNLSNEFNQEIKNILIDTYREIRNIIKEYVSDINVFFEIGRLFDQALTAVDELNINESNEVIFSPCYTAMYSSVLRKLGESLSRVC